MFLKDHIGCCEGQSVREPGRPVGDGAGGQARLLRKWPAASEHERNLGFKTIGEKEKPIGT